MKSVPSIISTKDLSYIEDMLNWNFILIKKMLKTLDFIHFYLYNIKAVKFSTQHNCHFGGQKTRRRCF